MNWLTRLRRRARALLRKPDFERDMRDEIRFHLEMEADELAAARGLSPEEARRQAAIAFGGVERFKEEGRDARGVRVIENLAREFRHAARTLGRSPGFAAAATLTLALGIAAVTAVFALVNRVLIQPLPYPDADQLVAVSHRAPGLGVTEAELSTGTYFHYRAHSRALEELALYDERVTNLGGDDDAAERVHMVYAGPELFEVFGVQPIRGRIFREEDGTQGFMDLNWTIPVLISHDLWQHRFGGDPAILGRVIRVNESPREVIGVMPPSFAFPSPETKLWVMFMYDSVRASLGRFDRHAVGRLRAGVSARSAAEELGTVLPSIVGGYRDATPERLAELQLTPVVVPLKDAIVGDRRTALLILLGGMGFLLLIACANVANLFLLRSEHRSREVALRTALGAGRADLVRLFFTESALLCAAGAAIGLVLASLGVSALLRVAPVELPRLHEVRLDAWTIAFTVGVAVLAVLAFTMLALLRFRAGRSLAPMLKSGGAATAGRERRRLRDGLVAVQVALALTLLVGSSLMVRSFDRLTNVDPGFESAGLLTVEVAIPSRRAPRHKSVYDAILERVRALPGTEAAAAVSAIPLDSDGADAFPVIVPGRAAFSAARDVPVGLRFFTTGYFSMMRIPIVEGVAIEPGDPVAAGRPVVISASLAERLFPNESPLGRPLRRLEVDGFAQSTEHDYTIAGVAADVRERSLRDGPAETVYVPILEPRVEQWWMPTSLTLVVRTDLPPLELASSVRRVIGEIDPAISVARVRTMDAIVRASTAQLSFVAVLLLIASIVALFLGAVGIYGVVAYAMRRRTQEIGIRIALGARPVQVIGMVLRESLLLVLAGLSVGVLMALAATRTLGSLLYGVSATDPLTLVAAALLLVLTALVASGVPARRAARIDAMVALRSE